MLIYRPLCFVNEAKADYSENEVSKFLSYKRARSQLPNFRQTNVATNIVGQAKLAESAISEATFCGQASARPLKLGAKLLWLRRLTLSHYLRNNSLFAQLLSSAETSTRKTQTINFSAFDILHTAPFSGKNTVFLETRCSFKTTNFIQLCSFTVILFQ